MIRLRTKPPREGRRTAPSTSNTPLQSTIHIRRVMNVALVVRTSVMREVTTAARTRTGTTITARAAYIQVSFVRKLVTTTDPTRRPAELRQPKPKHKGSQGRSERTRGTNNKRGRSSMLTEKEQKSSATRTTTALTPTTTSTQESTPLANGPTFARTVRRSSTTKTRATSSMTLT
ncbi:hypothetical protein K435DRAFT_871478 [Dendrothele bispora CBS 962.96]|uniref:Uncharacterized protein n=1 Tax=Dendrothele bispora (strain CBS 962.96) TaxID=1314807 RepID=A0A4S8L3Y8_DENBC|nr:hypothetical protein K435DRAFT_871478 [Dendrothele bispora CBS 962.96]